MRWISFACIPLFILISLGCGMFQQETEMDRIRAKYDDFEDWTFERHETSSHRRPAPPFDDLDLPFYGGKVEKAYEGFTEITYSSEQSFDQLKERWPQAFLDLGWRETNRAEFPSGRMSVNYITPDGLEATLRISRLGSLGVVHLSSTDYIRQQEEARKASQED